MDRKYLAVQGGIAAGDQSKETLLYQGLSRREALDFFQFQYGRSPAYTRYVFSDKSGDVILPEGPTVVIYILQESDLSNWTAEQIEARRERIKAKIRSLKSEEEALSERICQLEASRSDA